MEHNSVVCVYSLSTKLTVGFVFYNKKHQWNIVQTRQIQTKPY